MHGNRTWHTKLRLYAQLTAAIVGPYFVLQRVQCFPVTVMRPTALDRRVPFSETWTWAYLSFFLLTPATLACLPAGERLRRYAGGYLLIVALSHVIFFRWPTAVERPATLPHTLAYRMLLRVDRPINAMPSLHASISIYSALCCGRGDIWLWVAVILYATLATRQHVLADLVAGGLLALPVWRLTY